LMLQQENPDDYIIASGETHSVRELVACAFDYVGLDWQKYVSVDPAFYRPDEPVQLAGSVEKIRKNLQWQPKYSFTKLVESMVQHDLEELKS
ncbi:MAG: GDP-mannose 4,6-dehydratase, partial [Bacteroidota bacterium]